MRTNRCACGQPAPDAAICGACEASLAGDLDKVTGWLAEALDEAISRQVVFADFAGHGSITPLPFDEQAARTAWKLRNTLAAWVRVLAEIAPQRAESHAGARNGSSGYAGMPQSVSGLPGASESFPPDTIAAMALWLAQRMNRLRQHEDANEAVSEITDAVSDAQQVIDRPPMKVYAGPCDQCGTDLLAKPGEASVTCRTCEAVYEIAARREWMRAQLEDMLGSGSWCASMATALGLRVSEHTVRSWVKRHKLQVSHYQPPSRPDGEPKPMYRLGTVLDLAEEMRQLAAARNA